MKNNRLFLSILLVSSLTYSAQAVVITGWTFETSLPALPTTTTAATISGIAAEVGTGSASGVHASAATIYSSPAGNGSAESFNSNTWAVGDYYQFSSSTTGFQDITLSWDQTSSGTGPGEFKLAYQVNGGGFNDFLNYTVLPNSTTPPGLGNWSSATAIPGYNFTADLSAISSLDGATSVDFRLIMRTVADATPPGDVAAGGTSRVDNFLISGTAIPEPSAVVLGGLGLLGLLRRRRH